MSEPEAIKASDLVKLMDVVQAAAALYNELELALGGGFSLAFEQNTLGAWEDLGEQLRALGLAEVT